MVSIIIMKQVSRQLTMRYNVRAITLTEELFFPNNYMHFTIENNNSPKANATINVKALRGHR